MLLLCSLFHFFLARFVFNSFWFKYLTFSSCKFPLCVLCGGGYSCISLCNPVLKIDNKIEFWTLKVTAKRKIDKQGKYVCYLKYVTPQSATSKCFHCSSPSWMSFFYLTHASCSTRSSRRSVQSLLQYVRRYNVTPPSLAARVAKDLNIEREERTLMTFSAHLSALKGFSGGNAADDQRIC